MSIELTIPSVGESITEVQIAEWLKKEGDAVKKDENVAVIDSEKQKFKIEVLAKDLVTPWGMAFLPDGRLLITERPGRIRLDVRVPSARPRPAELIRSAEFHRLVDELTASLEPA